MLLPKCVKVERDIKADGLPSGIRYVGELLTYEGEVEPIRHPGIEIVAGVHVLDIARRIKWSGRLWRDSKIDDEDAWAATENFLLKQDVYLLPGRGFVVADEGSILLIGVDPEFQRRSVAPVLLRHVSPGILIAGTYDDNIAARKLYENEGMTIIKRELVFHK